MDEEPKLTVAEIAEQANLYVIIASNGQSILTRSLNIDGEAMDGLEVVYALRAEADSIEARVFK